MPHNNLRFVIFVSENGFWVCVCVDHFCAVQGNSLPEVCSALQGLAERFVVLKRHFAKHPVVFDANGKIIDNPASFWEQYQKAPSSVEWRFDLGEPIEIKLERNPFRDPEVWRDIEAFWQQITVRCFLKNADERAYVRTS